MAAPQPNLLRCPACASPLQAEDMDRQRSFAKCSHCGALMSLAGTDVPPPEWQPRPDLGLPPGLNVERTPDGLHVHRRWFHPAILVMLCFCIAWDSFLIFWYGMAFSVNAPWIFKVFPIAHLAVGVGLTYTTLAGLLNSTRVRLDRTTLTVRHGPIPWAGNRSIPRPDIQQLFCRRLQGGNRRQPSARYQVWVQTRDGSRSRLIGGGLDMDQALALEQQLERAMRIPDRPVPGEIER